MSTGGWKQRDAYIAEALSHARAKRMCLASNSGNGIKLLERRVEGGQLVRVFPHLYEEPAYWDGLPLLEKALRVIRGAALLHPEWIFCDTSAAIAYGLQVSQPNPAVIHIVTTPRAHTASTAHIVRHVLNNPSICTAGGVRVVDLATCVTGCLSTLDLPHGLAVADSCLRSNCLQKEAIEQSLAHINRRSRRNRALRTAQAADPRAENGGESVARGTMIELGFKVPDLQVEIPNPLDSAHPYRVDFLWPEDIGQTAIIGELDGMGKYSDPDMLRDKTSLRAFSDERIRESRLTITNARIMRFHFDDVLDRNRFSQLLDAFGVPRA